MITRDQLEHREKTKRRHQERLLLALQFAELVRKLDFALDRFLIDTTILKRSKADILDALLFSIANATDRKTMNRFSGCAILLTQFREGIGEPGIPLPDIKSFSIADIAANRRIQGNIYVRDVINHLRARSLEIDETKSWIAKAEAANPYTRPLFKKLGDIFSNREVPGVLLSHGYVDFEYHPISAGDH